MEKYLSYSGIIAIVLVIVAIAIMMIPIEGDAGLFYTLSAVITAFVFTPLFFVNHKKVYDAYKVPCYTTSAIVTFLLMIGSLLSGFTDIFGEPNFYSGAFLALCYLISLLLFKPPAKQTVIISAVVILMIGALLAEHIQHGTI